MASERVCESVRRAGGEPVLLPPAPGAWTGDALVHTFAGLVLPGGGDLDPGRYGGRSLDGLAVGDETHTDIDRLHDAADLALARAAVAAAVPLLAICRGMQVLNVALGGSLIEDLPAGPVPHQAGFHQVHLAPGCLVARAMGTATPVVSSYHHQAVDRLGEGLVATGRAQDGCVEVLEHRDSPVLAVQWHPEDDAAEEPAEQGLFDALVHPDRLGANTISMGGTR